MLIGELCEKAGVTKDTVRHYESLGLLQPTERQAGSRIYREYGEETLERLQLITHGKALFFTLRELKPLIDMFTSKKTTKTKSREVLRKKLAEVGLQISDAQRVHRLLTEKLRSIS